MREVIKKVRISIADFSELSATQQQLFDHAARVRGNAQAPYSKFHVGAAVLSNQGTIHAGCNVERCTWTQTTHAEQNAVDSMVAALGPVKIEAVAVVAAPAHVAVTLPPSVTQHAPDIEKISFSCAHCLQIIWENCFGDAGVALLCLLANGQVAQSTIGDALPQRFGPEDVGVFYQGIAQQQKSGMAPLP